MAKLLSALVLASCAAAAALTKYSDAAISVSSSASGASDPIPEAFVSFSIEFAFFPEFAGNLSSPNTFSDNLLQNIGDITGTRPYIRVGGNTQDYALYNASLKEAVNGTYNDTRSTDYPTTVYIGPSYFESYHTWPNTKFSHGFNLALILTSAGWDTLVETAPLACDALSDGRLMWWEYGNEPDLYSTSSQAPTRPSTWNESTYVEEWLNGTREIKSRISQFCPNLATNNNYGYISPSFAGVDNTLNPVTTFADGLDVDEDIKLISIHNYVGGATEPGVTLQKTLMNHTSTVDSASGFLAVRDDLAYTDIPFILGEMNSLYNEGAPGLSNAFGAALWGVDFNLWCASQGVKRTHMHQGVDYRYDSWQPVQTNVTTKGTKAPYYGNIAVASMLGDLTLNSVQISNIPLPSELESAYAAYVDGTLERIAVVNLREYNYTVNGTSSVINPDPRPSQSYTFQISDDVSVVDVQRLAANGSDAITGITWDGWSYNWELDNGKPVRLNNVTTGEQVRVQRGTFVVEVEDSSAAIINLVRG